MSFRDLMSARIFPPTFLDPGNFFYYHSHTTPIRLFFFGESYQCFHIAWDFWSPNLQSPLPCKFQPESSRRISTRRIYGKGCKDDETEGNRGIFWKLLIPFTWLNGLAHPSLLHKTQRPSKIQLKTNPSFHSCCRVNINARQISPSLGFIKR